MSFSSPIGTRISLDIFQARGQTNPDGWGIGYYIDGLLQVIKEPRPAVRSMLYEFAEHTIETKTLISHVRRSTCGVRSYTNTHPFYRSVYVGGRLSEFAFAHNGTVKDVDRFPPECFSPLGTTDSETIFCYILERLVKRGVVQWTTHDFEFLRDLLTDINDQENEVNCILTNGELLFCYSDENRHNGGLRLLRRTPPFQALDLVEGEDVLGTVEMSTQNIAGPPAEAAMGYIVVTRALTGGEWDEFRPGELVVFREGHIVFPDDRLD
ncbi:MAG: class II glutamine amidotransferase [Candidatus Thorarchaeota archaeon]|nr:class II glutamine amidotransferase [Candidatus Thorarchaeota archaeon]